MDRVVQFKENIDEGRRVACFLVTKVHYTNVSRERKGDLLCDPGCELRLYVWEGGRKGRRNDKWDGEKKRNTTKTSMYSRNEPRVSPRGGQVFGVPQEQGTLRYPVEVNKDTRISHIRSSRRSDPNFII